MHNEVNEMLGKPILSVFDNLDKIREQSKKVASNNDANVPAASLGREEEIARNRSVRSSLLLIDLQYISMCTFYAVEYLRIDLYIFSMFIGISILTFTQS